MGKNGCKWSVLCPHDCVADWGLWLTAQHHKRQLYTYLAQEKNPISEIQEQFLQNAYGFPTFVKLQKKKKSLGQTIMSQELSG